MKGLSPDETRNLLLSVGTHKSDRPLLPVEVGTLLQKALNAGAKRQDLADALYLNDTTMIGRFTRLLSLPSAAQPLIGWRSDDSTIAFTAASEIARLKTQHDHATLSRAVLEHQFSTSEVKEVVQIRKRSTKPIEDSVEAVLERRPVIERRHVIIGALQSESLRKHTESLTQMERNALLTRVLAKQLKDVSLRGAKLGTEFFLLVGDDRLHKSITRLPEGFEKAITEYLQEEAGIMQ